MIITAFIMPIIINIIKTLLLMFLYLFDIQYCISNEKSIYAKIYNNVKWSLIKKNGDHDGLIIGWYFVGYIDIIENANGTVQIMTIIIASKKFQKSIGMIDENNINHNKNSIIRFGTGGTQYHRTYPRFETIVDEIPKEEQKKDYDRIITHIKKNKKTVVLICGKSGWGKSRMARMIAKELDYYYTRSFDPFKAGYKMDEFMNVVKPTSKKRVVMLINEIDVYVSKIFEEKNDKKIEGEILITNKSDWNNFFDEIETDYQNIIIIMTSNKHPEWFDTIDASIMREGRIDIKIYIPYDTKKIM